MNRKIVGYIGVATIGIGFIMMAASNTLHSEIASVLQAVLSTLFIIISIMRTVKECKKNDK